MNEYMKAPGKADRKGITLLQVADMFKDEETAKEWIESIRLPDGPYCPECGSFNVQCDIKHKSMTHRCRSCDHRPMFSVRKGTVMEGTKMGYRDLPFHYQHQRHFVHEVAP